MSEGDKILIQTVLRTGRDPDELTEKVERLCDLSANLILESVARCLNTICDEKPFSSVRVPASMSARFNMGSKCAQHCLDLGYPDQDLGYQAFLYSNEKELRNIFMFLIDKIPRNEQIQDKDLGKFVACSNQVLRTHYVY